MKPRFLSGLSHAEFLRQHWQKKPLLARAALRDYAGAITRGELFHLAGRDAVDSRIITRTRGRWQVHNGPFSRHDMKRLPASGWTLLVQGVDSLLPQAARLLQEFSFIPYARLDDVMVSYAAPGGGVGPHFDSYDVFLIQGAGKRRWQVSSQSDLELAPGVPLKILGRFTPQDEWLLEPGDLLYLPPHWAHDGVAVGECMTYSIGFRAPGAQELGERFLEFLQDRLQLDGAYSDPDLEPARRPGRIPSAMLARTSEVLNELRWSRSTVVEFLGCYLTEPKPQVVFAHPRRPAAREQFAQRVRKYGVRLSAKTRMLFHGQHVFINGEALRPGAGAARTLTALADARSLPKSARLNTEVWQLLYDWYRAGYIESSSKPLS